MLSSYFILLALLIIMFYTMYLFINALTECFKALREEEELVGIDIKYHLDRMKEELYELKGTIIEDIHNRKPKESEDNI